MKFGCFVFVFVFINGSFAQVFEKTQMSLKSTFDPTIGPERIGLIVKTDPVYQLIEKKLKQRRLKKGESVSKSESNSHSDSNSHEEAVEDEEEEVTDFHKEVLGLATLYTDKRSKAVNTARQIRDIVSTRFKDDVQFTYKVDGVADLGNIVIDEEPEEIDNENDGTEFLDSASSKTSKFFKGTKRVEIILFVWLINGFLIY